MKVGYRPIYPWDIKNEVMAGNQVRILDKLLEEVYRPEKMSALDYIRVEAYEDKERYDCWVIEAFPEEENNEEVMKYVND